MFKYAIVVPTWNGTKLQECLQSIPDSIEVEVVNNKERGWCLAKSWNYAVKKYSKENGYDALIITNDDVVFYPETADLLVDALLRRQYEEKLPIDRECLVVKAWDKMGRRYYSSELLEVGWRNWYKEGWFCFATSSRLLEVCGEFDENFDPAYGEDTDMAYRIYQAGYGTISYAPVWHFGGTTSESDPERAKTVEEAKKRIWQYFIDKWGEEPSGGPLFKQFFESD